MTQIKLETIVEKSVKLKQAVKDSNIKEIVSLVESGAPTDIEIGGIPILLYAAQRDLWDVVEELFILNADMDIKYEIMNWTLVHQLSLAGKDKQLENYLPFIEDKNVKEDSKGQNALMIAVTANHYSTFKVLLNSGVELRSTDKEGNNVLHYVARAGWVDILSEVAEKHIQLFSLKNKNGETVLSITGMKLGDFVKEENRPAPKINENIEDAANINTLEDNPVEVEISPAKKKLSKIKRIS